MGASLNQLEPSGLAIFNNSCEEHAGPRHLQVNDAGQGDYYVLGNAAQNSQCEDVHDAGANSDAKEAWRFENISAFRGCHGGTMSGPTQGTAFDSRNAVHALFTPWSIFSPGSPTFTDFGCEACLDAIEVDNQGAVIQNVYSTSTLNRRPINLVHLGPYSANVSASGIVAGIGACPVLDSAMNDFSVSCAATGARQNQYLQLGNTEQITADTAVAIGAYSTLFSWFFPGTAQGTYTFHCGIPYVQSSGGVKIAYQTANAAASVGAFGQVDDSTTTFVSGYATGNTLLPTNVVATTSGPGVNNNVPIQLEGTVLVPASGTALNILMQSTTNAATVKAGAFCALEPGR